MKIIVIGGTGLIGSQTVAKLRAAGYEAVAASPASGVNAVTGEGLAEVLAGADAVVDVANSPSFEDEAAMDFFRQAGAHLLAAEQAAGVRHHVALSVVGTERLQASGYFRAKLMQEQLITAAAVPYTIVRATQFFEFFRGVADFQTRDGVVPPHNHGDAADGLRRRCCGIGRRGAGRAGQRNDRDRRPRARATRRFRRGLA